MGGWGSGRRSNAKRAEETCKRIDLRFLQKQGLIQRRDGFGMVGFGTLHWSYCGRPSGSVGYEARDYGLILRFKYGDDPSPIEQTIMFEWTPCNYGGKRLWFCCPRCCRRVLVVYGAGREFFCRHCYGLNYGSQHERSSDRLQRKARRVRERIGASNNLFEPIDQKPKWMHWKTFERLYELEAQANAGSLQAWLLSVPAKYRSGIALG